MKIIIAAVMGIVVGLVNLIPPNLQQDNHSSLGISTRNYNVNHYCDIEECKIIICKDLSTQADVMISNFISSTFKVTRTKP